MSPTERSGLDRDEVVRVALQLLDEVGLDGLTMRALADRLGVKAASLYWHLRDKDELADLLLEAINAQIPEPDPSLPWRERLERGGSDWRQALLRHRDAARLAMGRFVARPETLRRVEATLATLREAGLSPKDAADAAYLFSNFVPGFVAEETAARHAGPERSSPPASPATPGVEQGRLQIGWAKRLAIKADPTLPDLYAASGEGQLPEIYASNGIVKVLHTRGRKPAVIALNTMIPWEIEIRSGASQLSADLRGLQLRGFHVEGGISAVDLTAPIPAGTVSIEITGGSSKLTLHRPAEVPVRILARGGISHLTFDGRSFQSGGELTVQSASYDQRPDRYEIRLRGGASKIVVDTTMPPEVEPATAPRQEQPQSLADLPASAYPNLVAMSAEIMNPSMDDRFRFGLGVILDGLERRLQSQGRR